MSKMKEIIRKGLLITLALFMSTSMLLNAQLSEVKASEGDVTYEIYPMPQEVIYGSDSFVIRSNVNVVFESGLDEVTKTKLAKVLASKGITITTSDKILEGTTNILVGINGSKKYVDMYAKDKLNVSSDLFTKIDPYVLDIKDNTITILGDTTDSAFYGIVSLMHILNQIDGKTIQNVRINDFANTKTRGFIEGYYGIPWTNENRMSLMEFGGDFKMNMYAFAPKDDPYHSGKWRDPYPDDKLEEIRKMAKVGAESKCQFAWTIHPFMNGGITEATYDRDIVLIKQKFEQLYSVGVRQFGVLGDDAGDLPRNVVIKAMNELQEWVDSKGDVNNLVFCPAGYNNSWWINGELTQYDRGFNEDIQIFWTGNSVCAPVNQQALDAFRQRDIPAGEEERRSPLFWLNWPVNDINIGRLMMGKGSLLDPTIDTTDIQGVVTNPMQDAQASKVAIFSVADYAWNVAAFDDDKSWVDSFKYIDEDAASELYTIAKHMSDPDPNGHGLVLDESEELKPLLEEFLNAYENGEDITSIGNRLITEFEIIKEACDGFQKKSKNEAMKSELLPFTNSLKDLSEASISFIKTAIALENNDFSNVWGNYSQATSKLEASKLHLHGVLNKGQQPVSPSSKRIVPFATKMSQNLAGPVNSIIDDSKIIVTPITSRKDAPNSPIANMIDGDPSTAAEWRSPNSALLGEYVGIKFNRTINIKNTKFLMSSSNDNFKNTFAKAKVQYTQDGTTWVDLPGASYETKKAVIEINDLDLDVKGLRLISTVATSDIWLMVREISYNIEEEQPPTNILGNVIHSDTMSPRTGSLTNLNDNNLGTRVDFAKNPYVPAESDRDSIATGNYIGLEFASKQAVGIVKLNQGYNNAGNVINKLALEYSVDGTKWTLIKNIDNAQKDVSVDAGGIQAKYIRFKVLEGRPVWWDIEEISAFPATSKPALTPSVFKTSSFKLWDNTTDANLLDKNPSTYAWYDPRDGVDNDKSLVGDFVGVDLGREAQLGKIKIIMGVEGDYWSAYDLEYSTNGTDYTKYKSFTQNTGSATIDLDLSGENINARYVRIRNTQEKTTWIKIADFIVEEAVEHKTTVYTNSENLKTIGTEIGEEKSIIVPSKNIALDPQQYIGIELTRIRDLDKIVSDDIEGLTLQTSKNGIVWTTVSDKTAPEDAKYVRLVNLTTAQVSFDLTAFEVHSNEVYPISVYDTSFGGTETHLNLFDGQRTTETVLQSSQVAGKYIVYDLGQEINLNSLKAVLHDSTTDFPRHAKISGSSDATTWSTIMDIGNQDGANVGEAENTDQIGDVFPLHEISFNAKLSEGLDMNVRYIKFEITRSKVGSDKWIRFVEFEINGGDLYLPSTNNPTIETNAKPLAGYEKENLTDGDVATIFKPANNEEGFFTYNLVDTSGVNKVTILQSPKTISNAIVYAEVIETTRGRGAVTKWIELGKLNNSLNEFNTSKFDNVLSVKVAWEKDNVPEIHELLVSKSASEVVSKDALTQKLTEAKNLATSTWTPASVEVLASAITKAEYVKGNDFVTKVMVDDAISSLTLAIDNKLETGNLTKFAQDITNINDTVLTQENYVSKTWRFYSETLAKAQGAQTNKEFSQASLDQIVSDLQAAKNALVYEVISIENLSVLLEDAKKVTNTNYTVKSFADFTASFTEIEALITQDKTTRVEPSLVKAKIEVLNTLKESLVDLQELRAEIALAEKFNEAEFTGATFQIMKSALVEAKNMEAKEDATAKEVSEATIKLTRAREGLLIKADVEAMKLAIARLKTLSVDDYTINSYEALFTKISEVEAAINAPAGVDQAQLDAFAASLSSLEVALVYVEPLKKELLLFTSLDASAYSATSYKALADKVQAAQLLLTNGTKDEVSKALQELRTLADALEKLVEVSKVQQKIASYEAIKGDYTKVSMNAYETAIAEAKKWLDKDEITESQFQAIVASLDEAKDQLVSTTKLLSAIDIASKLDGEKYTTRSFKKYQALINDAKALLVDGNGVQIADMLKKLENTEKYLTLKVTMDELLQLYTKYSAIDLSIYTESSASILRNELIKTNFILSLGEASDALIKKQIKSLEDAFKALEVKPVVKPGTDENTSGGTSVDSPKTGDTTNVSAYFAILLLAGAFAVKARKKTKA